ncbi:MAG: hypothetical protein AB7S38_07970 [Vulcanimicrobiota bacterium]
MLAQRLIDKTRETTLPLFSTVSKRPKPKKAKKETPHARFVRAAQALFPDSEILGHFPA